MRKVHRVIVNGEEFSACRGDVLLDAALLNGIHIPHDCRSGHCGSCRVRVIDGQLFGSSDRHSAQACQSRIITDVSVVSEDVPDVTTTWGTVTALRPMAPDIMEVCIAPQHPVEHYPGQYLQVQFRGFPARCYSPTVPLDRFGDGKSIHLHVRRVPKGRVSTALGVKIGTGHRVKLKGPFGSAYLRSGLTNRLVLVATGTGFAPIWAIADAAMREDFEREVVLVASARSIESLYMIPALWRLATCPNVTIIPVTDKPQTLSAVIHTGLPTDYVPPLRPDDVVYAAGAPPMVEAVKELAEASGATLYTDPFVANAGSREGLLSRAVNWLTGDTKVPSPPIAPGPGHLRADIVRETAAAERLSPRPPSQPNRVPVGMRRR